MIFRVLKIGIFIIAIHINDISDYDSFVPFIIRCIEIRNYKNALIINHDTCRNRNTTAFTHSTHISQFYIKKKTETHFKIIKSPPIT